MSFYISLALERKTKQINQKTKTKNKKTPQGFEERKEEEGMLFYLTAADNLFILRREG